MADTVRLLSLLVSILAQTFFTLVRSHFMSLSFLTAWHNLKVLIGFVFYSSKLRLQQSYVKYSTDKSVLYSRLAAYFFTELINTFAGLKAGIS